MPLYYGKFLGKKLPPPWFGLVWPNVDESEGEVILLKSFISLIADNPVYVPFSGKVKNGKSYATLLV